MGESEERRRRRMAMATSSGLNEMARRLFELSTSTRLVIRLPSTKHKVQLKGQKMNHLKETLCRRSYLFSIRQVFGQARGQMSINQIWYSRQAMVG